jgi:HEAT repeat protein
MPFHSNISITMKFFPSLLTFLCLASPLLALDSAALDSVAAKFSDPSGDAQYAARIELNRLIDTATAPGIADRAAAIRAVEAVLSKPETPTEAKKYLLRALARVGDAESVPAASAIFLGTDTMLKEEARQVLATLGTPDAIAVLTKSLLASTDLREQLALLDSFAVMRATSAVPAIATMITKPDPELARAAVDALGKIGGAETITALGKLRTDSRLAAPLKQEIDKALLFAAKDNRNVWQKIYQTSDSPEVKLEAFLLLSHGESSVESIRDAMKSDDAQLRLAALKRGLESNQPGLLQGGLDRTADPFSANERLIVLANLPLLKPSDAAVEIAVGALKSEVPEERALAISALGHIGGKEAFTAVFQSLSIGDPTTSRASSQAISRISAPGADEFLLEKIQGPTSPEKLLAIKASAFRVLPGVRPLLIQIAQSGEKEAAQEAMKTLYAIGGIEELKTLCAAATSTTDPKLRGSLASFCKRLASRLGTDEAKQLADAVNAN